MFEHGNIIVLRNIARSDGTVTTAVPAIVLQDSDNLLATYIPQGTIFQNNWVVSRLKSGLPLLMTPRRRRNGSIVSGRGGMIRYGCIWQERAFRFGSTLTSMVSLRHGMAIWKRPMCERSWELIRGILGWMWLLTGKLGETAVITGKTKPNLRGGSKSASIQLSIRLAFGPQGMNLSNGLSRIAGRLIWGGMVGNRKSGGIYQHCPRNGQLIWEQEQGWINGRLPF